MAVLAHEGSHSILYGSWPIPVGSGHRTSYIARPDDAGRFPVVVLLPSIEGLGSTEKDLARRLARNGIVAIALDFFRKSTGDSFADYDSLDDERALTDIDEVHEFVSSENVDWAVSSDLGLFGLDVGGRFGLIRAATRPWVRSVVVAYTPLTGDEDRSHQVADYLSNLPIPVLGLYGKDDDLIDASTVDEAQRRNDHGQWLLYDGVGHGFLDPDGDGYDNSAAEDAFARALVFFKSTLDAAVVENLG